MSKMITIALLLVGAQVNLSALVPAVPGQEPPPWWVGGGALWPFFSDTKTVVVSETIRNAWSPLLGIAAAACFLLGAAAVWGWVVPTPWAAWLTLAGAVFSIALHVMWLSGWAVFPLVVDAALVWMVMGNSMVALAPRA